MGKKLARRQQAKTSRTTQRMEKNKMKTDGKTQKKAWVLLAAAMAMAVAPAAQAQLGAFGAVNATSGYPATVTDSTGLVLDLPAPVLGDGLNPPTMIFDPPGVGALEQAIGFATEAFYAY
ncbi:MAG: hypothetical protein HZC54_00005, partial [Verrucomicrobia bacterium]|nr:hypothetical protein [Verrucomicrobiota bacterium]